jgi:hypothetical protein
MRTGTWLAAASLAVGLDASFTTLHHLKMGLESGETGTTQKAALLGVTDGKKCTKAAYTRALPPAEQMNGATINAYVSPSVADSVAGSATDGADECPRVVFVPRGSPLSEPVEGGGIAQCTGAGCTREWVWDRFKTQAAFKNTLGQQVEVYYIQPETETEELKLTLGPNQQLVHEAYLGSRFVARDPTLKTDLGRHVVMGGGGDLFAVPSHFDEEGRVCRAETKSFPSADDVDTSGLGTNNRFTPYAAIEGTTPDKSLLRQRLQMDDSRLWINRNQPSSVPNFTKV